MSATLTTAERLSPYTDVARPRGHVRNEKPPILVVDDENGPRQALRMLLKDDHEVYLAQDVSSALEIMAQTPVDLVITDIRMPMHSGVELLQIIKKQCPETEVIILTGFAHLDTAMQAVEYGAFAYIEKPFDNDTMLRHIRAGLEKRRQERERRVLERLAIEANRFETLGRLVAGIIHDMGSPLSVTGSQIEMILSNPDRGNLMERLETMRSQVEHCNEMVRSAMNLLRYESQPLSPFHLSDLVGTCLHLAHPLLRSQNVEVTTDLAPDMPSVIMDLVLVRQAVLNLITNACYAMRKQENAQRITIRTWTEEKWACLSVADNGPGIPGEHSERVFDTFFTTKGKKGTGLGLAVVQNVMRRHDGSVTLVDRPGRGALFVLKFPVPTEEELLHSFHRACEATEDMGMT